MSDKILPFGSTRDHAVSDTPPATMVAAPGSPDLALLFDPAGEPVGVRQGFQAGILLDSVFVEAEDGASEARFRAGAPGMRRIELPADPTARQAFLASWSAQNSVARRGAAISLLLLPLAACGGGGTSTVAAPPGPPATTGFVIDGYVRNATVFRDANGNRQLDGGETSTTTDASGRFTLAGDLT